MSDIHLDLLDRIQIASPCPMRWEDMRGDDKVRHCDECDLKVTNLSAMTREEASSFVANARGRHCAGFYRRPDGTILTRDCPRGWALVRAKAHRGLGRIAAAVSLAAGAALLWARGEDRPLERARIAELQPFNAIIAKFAPAAPSQGMWIAGDVCMPSTPAPTPTPALVPAATAQPTPGAITERSQ